MTTISTSRVDVSVQKQFGSTSLDLNQLSIEQFKSLLPLDLAIVNYGKIDVEVAAIKANSIKTQKVQQLYLEAFDLYECGMFILAFDICNEVINFKTEDQLTKVLLGKLLEKINNKIREEKFSVLTDMEKEFSNKMTEYENEIRELKKNDGFNHEQKFKIYRFIRNVFYKWGQSLANNEEKRYLKSIEKYKKSLRVNKICMRIFPEEEMNINQAYILRNIGLGYLDLKVYSKALAFFYTAINIFEKSFEKDNDKKGLISEGIRICFAKTYRDISHVNKRLADDFLKQKKYKEALVEYEKGLEMMKKARNIYEDDMFLEWFSVLYHGAYKMTAKLIELNKKK